MADEPKFLHFLDTDEGILCLEYELKDVREEVRNAIIGTIASLQEQLFKYQEPRDPFAPVECPGCGRTDC